MATNEPMMVIRDENRRMLAIVPQRLGQDVLAKLVEALNAGQPTELKPKTIDLPKGDEKNIVADAYSSGGGKYAGKNPLAGLLPGEPFFFIRGRDACALRAIASYEGALRDLLRTGFAKTPAGKKMAEFAESVRDAQAEIEAWQEANIDQVKLPD